MLVSFRGKINICFHCSVEGHGKAQCPVRDYKTCYNCGSPTHRHSQRYEDTLVAYEFNKKKCTPYCYPRGFQGEEDVEYGNVTNEEEAFDHHMTFEPKFYTERARCRCYADTYADPPHIAP